MTKSERIVAARAKNVLELIERWAGSPLPVTEAQARKFKGCGDAVLALLIAQGKVTADPDRTKPLAKPEQMYRIWNFERGMWWRPCSNGYTHEREEAGLYSETRALDIVKQANRFSTKLEEAMVPV